jgi:diguanylate cyclase (GGDEF)-like protein
MYSGRILVVDDDQFYQEFCSEILGDEGHVIKSTYTGEEALEILKREKFDIMLLDLIMPGADGLEILEQSKHINPQVDVIIMTGYASVESAVKSLKSGAADYLTKPLNPEELKLTIKRIIELRRIFDENAELRNLLTLYESCQRVSLCLDLDKLYQLSLDAVLQSLQGDLGLSFFNINGDWTIKAYRGMDDEEAETLMLEFLDNEFSAQPSRVMIFDNPSVAGEKGAGRHLRIRSALAFKKAPNQPFDRMDLGTARFISEQVHLSFENAFKYMDAQRLVFIDDLTGLFNTRYLDMSLQTELKRAKRFKNHLSLLFIDLDYFKTVNDTYGHLVGSKLLIEVSKVLKDCVREIDVVVRYGGDEFIIILVETDRAGAVKVAERIRQSLEGGTLRSTPPAAWESPLSPTTPRASPSSSTCRTRPCTAARKPPATWSTPRLRS